IQNAHAVPQHLWLGEYRTFKRRLQRFMARLSIGYASQVVFISRSLRDWARPYWRRRASEPLVAYPGVTLTTWTRTAQGSTRECPHVLMVGNLVSHKRVDHGIRAFARFALETEF